MTVTSVSPQGEVAQVRQVVVKFSDAVVPFGAPKLPDPFTVACTGTTISGTSRWVDDRSWRFDFAQALPPGARCSVAPKADWQPTSGTLEGARRTSFQTGGPAINRLWPSGGTIEEDQHFLVLATGPAVAASVQGHVWCEADGIGERIPARIVTGATREDLIKQRKLNAFNDRLYLLACQRPLPSDTDVRFVWGAGIAAQVDPKIVTSAEQRFDYHVRAPFTAEFSCERERANAGCLPLRPMNLSFTSSVPRALLEAVRLKPAQGDAIAPFFDADDKSAESTSISFKAPLPEGMRFSIVLPSALRDVSGRDLSNAGSFPLAVATGATPPIAKFLAAPFGIVESQADSMLPVTLRHVQGDLRTNAPSGSVRDKRLLTDADMLAWFAKVAKYHENSLTAKEAGLPPDQWTITETVTDARGRLRNVKRDREVATRELSLLTGDSSAARLDMPMLQGGDPRPFEVVGIPLTGAGYHVVEIESARLGQSLLDKPSPMFVRTGVLLTNLGVHFKHGRESSLVWVTSLDRGRPVEGAQVAINDCNGRQLWSGATDAQGIARVASALPANPNRCTVDQGYFVTARKAASSGQEADVSFVFSGWQKGIESWRFNVPTSANAQPDVQAHTVLDRSLFRAGETVSMKHFLRLATQSGLSLLASDSLPTEVKITHEGTGQSVSLPLAWLGQRSAQSQWIIPAAAKLGSYQITLERHAGPNGSNVRARSFSSGSFRVEEFRLPLVDARIQGPKAVAIAPAQLPLSMQIDYFSGGAMANAKATVSAVLKPRFGSFPGFEEFSFDPPRELKASPATEPDEDTDEDDSDPSVSSRTDGKLVADKVQVTTDKAGAASLALNELPTIDRASELTAEMTFNDPNGEAQTVSTTVPLWPSSVVVGIKSGSWTSNRGRLKYQVLALDTNGKALKSQAVSVTGRVQQTISTRKRMVGGFYAYDNRTDVKTLGELCSGKTDDRGLLLCESDVTAAGQVELIAKAVDASQRASQASTTVWVTRQGEVWFDQDNDDRIDLLPEKKRVEPGETARLQVRMPYRQATALVTVEREGIMSSFVTAVRGDDPVIDVPIPAGQGYSPNVYVSALVLRGRVREVPWYSLFTWGWKEPIEWARTFWYDGKSYQAPTAMVDLAKPSYKLGLASLQVGLKPHELQVAVTADKAVYGVRETVKAKLKVTQNGQPVRDADLAFAAVDEGLLALQDNDSWDLLHAMFEPRPLGVETSTAQSEIIGRRHYGRKAVAAGGGGGRGSARELFNTLLLWKGHVELDASGEATIDVPLNDSLTTFRLVAIADAGAASFGTAAAKVRVTQDLQALSGLPPLVREGDRFSAMLTVRNSTARTMQVHAELLGQAAGASGEAGAIKPAPQDVQVAAGGAAELSWNIEVPPGATAIDWQIAADEKGGAARDRVKVRQSVQPAVPITVQQATLTQLDQAYSLAITPPADGLTSLMNGTPVLRGGIQVALQPSLTGALPGIRRYFETYPFICLEQKVSKAVGLRDTALWQRVAGELPTYLDSDGLAAYFPPRADDGATGSDALTAYLLSSADVSGFHIPDEARDDMVEGLTAFVEGRLKRDAWQPPSLKVRAIDVRKLAAVAALSRYDRATPRMLGSIEIAPNVWPTSALIDWYVILRRTQGIPDQARRLDEVQQILRSRLTYAGTTLRFSTEDSDFWWWTMESSDANAAKLVLAVLDDPAWQGDLPRMMVGSLARQKGGAWLTTTANLWGSLALDKFKARFESTPVSGRTLASLGPAGAASEPVVDWQAAPGGGQKLLPWPPKAGSTLQVTQQGDGRPWLTVQSLAAVPLKGPDVAGYRIKRKVTAIEQKQAGRWSRGDVVRVRLEVDAQSDMTWVVIADPVPAGATLLGSSLGRDSAIATRGENRTSTGADPVYQERSFEAFRSYYDVMPRGTTSIEYTMRLNNAGHFGLPPTRVEAMYSPETYGAAPNADLEVQP